MISVIMSCYNAEKYLSEAIDSILSQTYGDFEFIIWNDGSKDSTEDIVKSYKDERIRYYYHTNTGLGMALKLACDKARGEFIARMDSDDISLPNRFEKEISFLKKKNDYVLVSSAVFFINEEGGVIGRSFPCTKSDVLTKSRHMTVHPMVMMRRDAYLKSGGYIPLKYMEDDVFWSRMAKQGKFGNITTPLGKYRLLPSSLGHNRSFYDNVLTEFRNKMINDETIVESDVEMYNYLYQYFKQFKKQIPDAQIAQMGKSTEEQVFNVLRALLGQHIAEQLIVGIKNIIYSFK